LRGLPEPPAQVFFSRFSSDGLEMTLNFWVANQLHTRMAVLSRVNTAVWSALSDADIKLPPPKAIVNLFTSTGDESR
jgi:small-conductance mechanosensitive channel